MEERARHELLKSIYEQHWLHARHVENERLWFTNIYMIIVGALLAYTFDKQAQTSSWPWPILLIVFILSMVGFLMCHSLRIPFVYHTVTADKIQLEEWGLPYNYITYKPEKFFSFHEVFSLLYSVMSSLSLGFLTWGLLHNVSEFKLYIATTVGVVCFCLLYFVFHKYIFKKRENKNRFEIIRLKLH